MNISVEERKRIVDYLTGRRNINKTPTNPTSTSYIAISTTDPSAPAGAGTVSQELVREPVGNGYARVLLGNSDQSMTQKMSAAGIITTTIDGESVTMIGSQNSEFIYFNESTGAWTDGTAGADNNKFNYYAIYTHATSTASQYLIGYGKLKNVVTISGANVVPLIQPQNLIIGIANQAE